MKTRTNYFDFTVKGSLREASNEIRRRRRDTLKRTIIVLAVLAIIALFMILVRPLLMKP